MSIAARAPARVSLVGGGTDLPAYYERNGGAVVSFSIQSYATATVEPRASGIELVSTDTGAREVVPEAQIARRIRPPILAQEFLVYQKAVAWHFGLAAGRIAVASTIPPGAGLASSGAIAVALVRATATSVGDELTSPQIAEAAFRIETAVLRRTCGKQDQYASAFGGLNLIEFFHDGSVDVTPLRIAEQTRAALASRLMLFHNGSRRSAVGPLQEQARRSSSDPETVAALDRLKQMAYETREVLERGEVGRVGELLHEAWEAKQHLNSQVSTPDIVRVYALARRAGAVGGKLAGAGLAGTLVLFCPEEVQEEVRMAMASQGWRERSFQMDEAGVSIVDPIGAGDGVAQR